MVTLRGSLDCFPEIFRMFLAVKLAKETSSDSLNTDSWPRFTVTYLGIAAELPAQVLTQRPLVVLWLLNIPHDGILTMLLHTLQTLSMMSISLHLNVHNPLRHQSHLSSICILEAIKVGDVPPSTRT
jgi:hypothetical protein